MNITDGHSSTTRHDPAGASPRPARSRVLGAAAAAAAVAALGLTACAAPGLASAPQPAKTVTEKAAADAGNESGHGSRGTHKSAPGKLPEYQPSSVVSKTSTSTVLSSPDSVTKVGAFYSHALAQGGWDVTSSSASSFHASFTAHRNGEGASISVYPRWGGSGISISTYPR